jgi:hypothetical protein
MHLVYVAVDFGHAVLRDADHGVRLAAARLPVGENARCAHAEDTDATKKNETSGSHVDSANTWKFFRTCSVRAYS